MPCALTLVLLNTRFDDGLAFGQIAVIFTCRYVSCSRDRFYELEHGRGDLIRQRNATASRHRNCSVAQMTVQSPSAAARQRDPLGLLR